MKQNSYPSLKTVIKVFRLLEVLGEDQSAKPSDLAERLKMPRSNIYRLLETLRGLGYVDRTSDSKYSLSFKVFMLGSTVIDLKQLPPIARPYMARLAELAQENINLATMYEKRVLYIDKIESRHYLKLDQPIGKTDPLHCTALGKVLLSGFNEIELEVFLRTTNLSPFTKNTITNPDVLIGVIRNVRNQGFAYDLEELSEGINCIAASIRNHTNKIIAAVSISGPTVRLKKQKIEDLRVPLIKTVADISKQLGSTHIWSTNLD